MVRLEEEKNQTEHKAIEVMPLPAAVYIPLTQHLGKACLPQVKIGDSVLVGQHIAGVDAHVYAPIHASVSGRVTAITNKPHPVLGDCQAMVIDSDTRDELFEGVLTRREKEEVEKLEPSQIRNIIFESGIVGMGGAGFPTHIKLNPPKPVSDLIINAAECEPYLTADYRLMMEKTEQILAGIGLAVKCLGVKKVHVAIEDNKPEAIKAFEAGIKGTGYELCVLKSDYPQGGEKQLIKNILKKEVPSGKLPFEVGTVVQNVATVFAIYEAVYLHKPLYERVITVTGTCLSNPKNLLVRIGTLVKDIIEYCGQLKEAPHKILIGGPMMGISQYTDEVPVIKTTTGIILMNEQEAKARQELSCIRCGACVRACPVGLMPCMINLAAEKELWSTAQYYGAIDCIECGCCNYVCPANRNMVQSIKRAKLEISK
jgi:electron transport complex protein RnfC